MREKHWVDQATKLYHGSIASCNNFPVARAQKFTTGSVLAGWLSRASRRVDCVLPQATIK
jgi:hypothetical protein